MLLKLLQSIKPEANLEQSQTSKIKLSCKKLLLTLFVKKVPSEMFDFVLNTPLNTEKSLLSLRPSMKTHKIKRELQS